MKLTIREYLTPDGKSPFRHWLGRLDIATRARIQARVLRFEMGNLGDHKSVGGGVWESRVAFGPGYRLYFGKQSSSAILLLLGGDKSSQSRDISRAHQFWAEVQEMKRHGSTH